MAANGMKRFLVRVRTAKRRVLAKVLPIVRPVWDFAKEPVLAVLFALAATTAIARPYYVPTGSMEPTIAIGDEVLASKFAYGYSRYSVPYALGPSSSTRLLQRMPERGDVIVFQLPRDPGQAYVKRVIGLPGDRVQLRDGRVWLNGKELALKPAGTGPDEMENGDDDSRRPLHRNAAGRAHASDLQAHAGTDRSTTPLSSSCRRAISS